MADILEESASTQTRPIKTPLPVVWRRAATDAEFCALQHAVARHSIDVDERSKGTEIDFSITGPLWMTDLREVSKVLDLHEAWEKAEHRHDVNPDVGLLLTYPDCFGIENHPVAPHTAIEQVWGAETYIFATAKMFKDEGMTAPWLDKPSSEPSG